MQSPEHSPHLRISNQNPVSERQSTKPSSSQINKYSQPLEFKACYSHSASRQMDFSVLAWFCSYSTWQSKNDTIMKWILDKQGERIGSDLSESSE